MNALLLSMPVHCTKSTIDVIGNLPCCNTDQYHFNLEVVPTHDRGEQQTVISIQS